MSQFIRRCCVSDNDDIPSSEYLALLGPESSTDYQKAPERGYPCVVITRTERSWT